MRRLILALILTLSACATGGGPPQAGGPVSMRLERLRGGTFDLGSQRGRLVMINFFATWCLPCVAEIPQLVELQRRYRSQGLQVVAVSMDLDGRAVLEPFLAHFGDLGFPVLLASERFFDGETPFGPIRVLPTTAVVDRRGRFVGVQAGMLHAAETERLVQVLLANERALPPRPTSR